MYGYLFVHAGDCIHIDCPGSCLASLFEPTWRGSSTCRCHHSSVDGCQRSGIDLCDLQCCSGIPGDCERPKVHCHDFTSREPSWSSGGLTEFEFLWHSSWASLSRTWDHQHKVADALHAPQDDVRPKCICLESEASKHRRNMFGPFWILSDLI